MNQHKKNCGSNMNRSEATFVLLRFCSELLMDHVRQRAAQLSQTGWLVPLAATAGTITSFDGANTVNVTLCAMFSSPASAYCARSSASVNPSLLSVSLRGVCAYKSSIHAESPLSVAAYVQVAAHAAV